MNFNEYLQAGFPALWVETAEPERTIASLIDGVPIYEWDVLRGGHLSGKDQQVMPADPIEALSWLANDAPQPAVLVCHLWHKFCGSVDVQQAILNAAATWKATGRTLVALVPPGSRPPVELQRTFHVLEQPLPDKAQLRAVADGVVAGNEGASIDDTDGAVEALRGLTAAEAENVIALAAVRGAGAIAAREVQRETSSTVRAASGGTLEVLRPTEGFASLGGMERLKSFCGAAVQSELSRGVILLGVAGTGKTVFAQALAAETGLPLYLWDLGRLFGSLVGESEAAARRTIKAIEAAGRAIVLIDEVEKGAAGMGGSGANDSGVTARTMSTVLTWLSDRQAGGAYVIATANDVMKLPPEMTRAERWDAVFFVDLPSRAELKAIYAIHAQRFGITEPFPGVMLDGWTGAEVKCLCRTAAMLGVPLEQASQYVVPLSRSRADEVRALRDWAGGRTVAAGAAEPTSAARGRALKMK